MIDRFDSTARTSNAPSRGKNIQPPAIFRRAACHRCCFKLHTFATSKGHDRGPPTSSLAVFFLAAFFLATPGSFLLGHSYASTKGAGRVRRDLPSGSVGGSYLESNKMSFWSSPKRSSVGALLPDASIRTGARKLCNPSFAKLCAIPSLARSSPAPVNTARFVRSTALSIKSRDAFNERATRIQSCPAIRLRASSCAATGREKRLAGVCATSHHRHAAVERRAA